MHKLRVNPELLAKYHKPVPRYTSYPPATEWHPLPFQEYEKKLKELSQNPTPLSLYLHIPFCKSMCLYCGCSVVLNRKEENEERYVDYLFKEIDLVTGYLGKKQRVTQLHFGGGTPTKLSIPLFSRLFDKIASSFEIDFSKEVAIEIDPRTVISDDGAKLRFLRQIGFNRVSFGVQDTNQQVQEAIKRRQSIEMTEQTYWLARELGFKGINIDLIYGLPYQTIETFRQTIQSILELRPDRIALFSYAKVPWLKPHQKAIAEETLPTTNEKFQIYAEARDTLISNGYTAIGMDHFALEEDELTRSYHEKTLQRNFQGYTVRLAENFVALGASSIGFVKDVYFQNLKELEHYYASLDQGILPICRGKALNEDDSLRKWVIHTLMCTFEIEKEEFKNKMGIPFNTYFSEIHEKLIQLEEEGLIENHPEKLIVTSFGELFIRLIAVTFDGYSKNTSLNPKFSQSI